MKAPKYSEFEHERRFIIPEGIPNHLEGMPYRIITDRYLSFGRLRLRRIENVDGGEVTYKLCKKYGPLTPSCEPIVNIYLDAKEYNGLLALPGTNLTKHRYHDEFKERQFGIDAFQGELSGLTLCETEAKSKEALFKSQFPPYATIEVTEHPFFSGGRLIHARYTELENMLAELHSKGP